MCSTPCYNNTFSCANFTAHSKQSTRFLLSFARENGFSFLWGDRILWTTEIRFGFSRDGLAKNPMRVYETYDRQYLERERKKEKQRERERERRGWKTRLRTLSYLLFVFSHSSLSYHFPQLHAEEEALTSPFKTPGDFSQPSKAVTSSHFLYLPRILQVALHSKLNINDESDSIAFLPVTP